MKKQFLDQFYKSRLVGKTPGSSDDKGKSKIPTLPTTSPIPTGLVDKGSSGTASAFEKELLENASTIPSPETTLKRKPRVKLVNLPTKPPPLIPMFQRLKNPPARLALTPK
jgi:hypothetical protein